MRHTDLLCTGLATKLVYAALSSISLDEIDAMLDEDDNLYRMDEEARESLKAAVEKALGYADVVFRFPVQPA